MKHPIPTPLLGAGLALATLLSGAAAPGIATHAAAAGSTVLSVKTIVPKPYMSGGDYGDPTGVSPDPAGGVDISYGLHSADNYWWPAVVRSAPDGTQTTVWPNAGGGKIIHDAQGTLYRAAGAGVTKTTPAGATTTVPANPFKGPYPIQYADAVAVDAQGDVYIGDVDHGAATKVAPDGTETLIGNCASGNITGLALDGRGNLYIACGGEIDMVTPAGVQIRLPFAGLAGNRDDVAVDPYGDVFVADTYNSRIVELTPDGTQTTLAIDNGRNIFDPEAISIAADGTLYVAELATDQVDVVTLAPPPSIWTRCADESGTCAFSGAMVVAYGANGSYTYQMLTGGTPCTNAVLGDAAPNRVKACYTAPATGAVWSSCAAEGGTCAFSGTMAVLYGTKNTYTGATFTGGTACNNTVFGDPIPNSAKACYVAASAPYGPLV